MTRLFDIQRMLIIILLLLFLFHSNHSHAAKTYADNGDGTVTDPTTGLTWIRCAMGQTWDAGAKNCTGTASTYSWDQANGLTGSLSFAGKTDWRLPNIRELTTIVDLSVSSPSIDGVIFPSTPPFTTGSPSLTFGSNFWTSSALAPDPSLGWIVDFYYGGTVAYHKTLTFYARLVRGGQAGTLLSPYRAPTDYIDNQDGTVTHTPTGLVWKRCAEGQDWNGSTCTGFGNGYTWNEAKALTGTVSFAGQTDWRLPERADLLSLVNYFQSSPAINTTIFPATSSSRFWTSSDYAPNPSYAWFVYFHQGDTYAYRKDDVYNVRLVRSSTSATNPTRLLNIATRGKVETVDNVMIAGFIIQGIAPKKVLIRARGPSLAAAPFNVPGTLSDPFLTLYSGATPIDSNDDFALHANAAQIPADWIPANAKEAAIVTTLNPGAYTAIVNGVGATSGVAIVEVFEIDQPGTPLINIATRGPVYTGDNVMIAGLIIQGDAPKTVLITARGPSMAGPPHNVPGTLANPTLSLFSGQTVIATNDNWTEAANAAQIQTAIGAPSNTLESAILVTLQPGAYTAIVSGAGGGTGLAIVEVFAQ